MNTTLKLRYILVLAFIFFVRITFAHDVPVHVAITINAAASAHNASSAYVGFLNTVSSDISLQNAINDMAVGSDLEDNKPQPMDEGGYRSINHFYDPLDTIYGKGLSDFPPDQRKLIATNSFSWGSISNSPGLHIIEGVTLNRWSWPNARSYEWLGLTAAYQSDRFLNLSNTFRAVGQVMHLLEDTSQPQHVRNEQHLDKLPGILSVIQSPWLSPIEEYGRIHINQLNYGDGTILDWRDAGFTKLEDFWDRHKYNSSGSVLAAAENGGTQLGLAEWCNGNFLGARHLFPEYYKPGVIEYYPFPSRNHSTDYSDVQSHPEPHVHNFTNDDGTVGKGIYLTKTGDGITGKYIARVNYFGAKIPGLTGTRYCTIDDPNVERDYHDQFIPKAVKYSAGLLDYFFRGTMDVLGSGYDTDLRLYTNVIVNTSSQPFKGGAFSIYQDDSSGNRSLVTSTNLNDAIPGGTLATNASFIMTFSGTPVTNKLLLVYQGKIGVDGGGNALDPVDADTAIAAKSFYLGQIKLTVSANPLWTDAGLVVTNGQTLFISASGTWAYPLVVDANGSYGRSTDGFLSGANEGALIAYVGTHPPYEDSTGANRWGDNTYFPQAAGSGYWLAGKQATITADRSGELWFLINDDAVSKTIGDNSGDLSVTVWTQ